MVHDQPVVPDQATSTFGVPIVRIPNMTDEDVMEQLRNGYPDALPILFDRFHRLVLKIALRILRDRGEAEDVTQLSFLKSLTKRTSSIPSRAVREHGFSNMPTIGV